MYSAVFKVTCCLRKLHICSKTMTITFIYFWWLSSKKKELRHKIWTSSRDRGSISQICPSFGFLNKTKKSNCHLRPVVSFIRSDGIQPSLMCSRPAGRLQMQQVIQEQRRARGAPGPQPQTSPATGDCSRRRHRWTRWGDYRFTMNSVNSMWRFENPFRPPLSWKTRYFMFKLYGFL